MSRQLLTPSPSPPPPVPTPTLPAQINAATRKQHTFLNRLIVDRLSLALPPNASDPTAFGHGLAAFAQIYFAFEDAWLEIENSATKDDTCLSGTHALQVRRWLSNLRPEGLHRSSRLRDDLEYISSRTGPRTYVGSLSQRRMFQQMRLNIEVKPHILIAYGWVMYMAVFSGGRWIRQQLSNAGIEFWTGEHDYMNLEKQNFPLLQLPGFNFLSFDGDQDGEDIKSLFKARLAEAETLLTQQERHDVLLAAQKLFEDCIALVEVLDRAVWWQQAWVKFSCHIMDDPGDGRGAFWEADDWFDWLALDGVIRSRMTPTKRIEARRAWYMNTIKH